MSNIAAIFWTLTFNMNSYSQLLLQIVSWARTPLTGNCSQCNFRTLTRLHLSETFVFSTILVETLSRNSLNQLFRIHCFLPFGQLFWPSLSIFCFSGSTFLGGLFSGKCRSGVRGLWLFWYGLLSNLARRTGSTVVFFPASSSGRSKPPVRL